MQQVTVLDGGMSRELMRVGAPFRQPEWSALALLEAPDLVRAAHAEFARAGAEVITTNAYAVVPFHLGTERFATDGARLAALAGALARDVADEFGVRVAGCLPPPLGSYRPDLFEPREAAAILDVLVAAQAPFVDVWLAETLSSIAEAELAASLVHGSGVPVWLSFTVDDDDGSRLRSGEPVEEAVARAVAAGAEVVAFNCSSPVAIEAAVRAARMHDGVRLGAYANALEHARGEGANEGLSKVRDDATPAAFCEWADRWIDAGAMVVGGCCGIDAPHIRTLVDHLSA